MNQKRVCVGKSCSNWKPVYELRSAGKFAIRTDKVIEDVCRCTYGCNDGILFAKPGVPCSKGIEQEE